MIIRQLTTPEELAASQRVDAICFEFPLDYQKTLEQARNGRESRRTGNSGKRKNSSVPFPPTPSPRDHLGRFFPPGGTDGRIGVNPYTVHYDGHQVLMGGIGGVATLPNTAGAE